MQRIGGTLAGLIFAGVLAAAGCQGPAMLAGKPVTPPRDPFVYKNLEHQAPVVTAGRPTRPSSLGTTPERLPSKPPEPPKAAPALPPHDAGWEVAVQERPWRWIVVHHSASDTGSAAAFDAFHRNTRHWDELGYHFVIGNGTGSGDGLVEVGSRWPKQKWGAHCRVGDNEEYNNFGIGICLVGDFDKRRPTAAQMAALARLIDYLAVKYNIDDSHIIGHGTVDDTKCPGRNCPVTTVLGAVHRARVARAG
jgi:N-acetylmuramoyl-L-alanine amidase